jgi:ATP-dependent Clp protease adaptor protein ClpS
VSQRPSTVTRPEVREKVELAPRWRVIIHNDDVTPMEFVVGILLGVFGLERVRATRVMLEAHTSGVAHVVTLALEEAEARVDKAHGLARVKRYPLTFSYEPDA